MPESTDALQLTRRPVSRGGMLIRRPVGEVFEAFVDPSVTTRFWFTGSSGRLEPGAVVEWTWEMYDVSTTVTVKAIEKDRRILVEWHPEAPSTIEWTFEPGDDGTFVRIVDSGFGGSGDEIVARALDSIQGFTLVLAGLKAYLEHGIELNLVADFNPPQFRS